MATRADSGSSVLGVWKVAQFLGVVLTVVLLAGLYREPDLTLKILWNAVIPLLPAVFLVQPEIWRNACPLATLNVLSGRRAGKRTLSPEAARRFGAVGIVLLFAMVPARRFLFNTDGTALAITITAVAVLALVLGFVFDMKAGFCNALCPVLPVERLYGQRPLFKVPNAHCKPCTLCTRRGCIDLVQTKSVYDDRRRTFRCRFRIRERRLVDARQLCGRLGACIGVPDSRGCRNGSDRGAVTRSLLLVRRAGRI